MVTYHSHIIVAEGWRPVTLTAVLGLIAQITVGLLLALPFWLVTLVLGYLFRDPFRKVPPKPLAVVSPVDGTVIGIETMHDILSHQPVIQIQMRMGYFDVMATRSPMEGKIIKQWFGAMAAKNLATSEVPSITSGNPALKVESPVKAGELCKTDVAQTQRAGAVTNCRFAQWIQSDEQDNVVMAEKSASGFLKPRCYAHSGDRIGQGQRCGIIPFYAVVQVNVPLTSRLEVKVGDKVCGGADTLATLIH